MPYWFTQFIFQIVNELLKKIIKKNRKKEKMFNWQWIFKEHSTPKCESYKYFPKYMFMKIN